MFNADKFTSEELQDIYSLLYNKDATVADILGKKINYSQTNCVILNLFFEIYYEKYISIKNIYTSQNKFMNYEHKVFSDNHNISNTIYDRLKEDSSEFSDIDNCEDSTNILEPHPNILFGLPIKIIRAFLIQVFIYSQNSHSPLMKYASKNEDSNSRYEIIPFVYNLSGASIEEKFAYIVLSPIRIEPRISKILLSKNDLREYGLYEIGKTLIFNKHIKNIELNYSLLKKFYIEFLNVGMGLFYNDSVEELNLSYNYLKDISEESLAKLISHFKGLKTLNLAMNEFKRGLSSFFIVLKKLYRKRKTKLENLILNMCLFDEASYYEFGELLKCKYCKLKRLSIYGGNIPYNINFLKKLSKNKSIEIIYINKLEIGNNNVNDILKIICNTQICYLSLYKNKISNFNYFLRILYRTKKIENEIDYNKNNESFLTNIDLSNNSIYIKNVEHIELIEKIINQTTSNCIDISHILFGSNPNKNKLDNNCRYKRKIEQLKDNLENSKNNFKNEFKKLRKVEANVKRLSKFKNEHIFIDLEEQILEIINNKNSFLPIILKKHAGNIMNDRNNEEIRKLFLKNNEVDNELYKNIENKLVNYMIYKASEKKMKEIQERKKLSKLILF